MGERHPVVETILQGNQTICGSYPLSGCVAFHNASPAPHYQRNCCVWLPEWHPVFISVKPPRRGLRETPNLQSAQGSGCIKCTERGSADQGDAEQGWKFYLIIAWICRKHLMQKKIYIHIRKYVHLLCFVCFSPLWLNFLNVLFSFKTWPAPAVHVWVSINFQRHSRNTIKHKYKLVIFCLSIHANRSLQTSKYSACFPPLTCWCWAANTDYLCILFLIAT